MNIKHAVRSLLPPVLGKVSETKLKESVMGETKASADKEANGQQQEAGDESRRNLTEEEIQEAITILESMAGVKDSGLKFKLVRGEAGVPVVHVEDRDGKIVRRIAETELSQVKARTASNKTTGNILNRAM